MVEQRAIDGGREGHCLDDDRDRHQDANSKRHRTGAAQARDAGGQSRRHEPGRELDGRVMG